MAERQVIRTNKKVKSKPGATRVSPLNTHLRELQAEARRVKGLYDPTAREGFQYGKGTM